MSVEWQAVKSLKSEEQERGGVGGGERGKDCRGCGRQENRERLT